MEPPVFPPPAPPTLLSTWRARLQPWLDALQFKLRLEMAPLPTRDEMRGVWLALDYFRADDFDSENWTRMLEALELLDLLAHVDGHVGWALLLEMAEVDRVFRINEAALFDATAVRPRYALELDDSESRINLDAAFAACCRMVDVDYSPIRSRGFVEVEQLLLCAWSEAHGGERFDRACQGRIAIKLRLRVENCNQLAYLLHELHQLALLAKFARFKWARLALDQQRDVQNAFVAAALDLRLLCHDTTRPVPVVEKLLAIADHDFAIVNLVVHPSLLRGSDRVDLLFRTLLDLGLQRLVITSRYDLTEVITSALCAALSQSHVLTELVLGGSGDSAIDREPIVWDTSWLAHAVFAGAGRVRSLALKVDDLQMAQINAIREALECCTHPSSSCGMNTEDARLTSVSALASSGFKQLTLDYVDPASRPAVLELLRLVGGSLERLKLRHYGVDSLSCDFMDAVLVHCPQLKRLHIEQVGGSLEWLYAPHADTRRRGWPASLVIDGRMEQSSVGAFFRSLELPHHPLTNTLRQLHWSVWGGNTPPFPAMDAWLRMLSLNRRLERSEIVMSEKGASAYQLAKYQERFEAHNGEPLLDVRKLALLSVFTPFHRSPTYQLTPECLQLVLEFAWRSKKRICG